MNPNMIEYPPLLWVSEFGAAVSPGRGWKNHHLPPKENRMRTLRLSLPQYRSEKRVLHPVKALSLTFLIATLLTNLFTGAIATATEETLVDGVLHVKNGSTPAGGVETLELEELWRIGGDDEDSVLIGAITQALVDDDNNIYLLDAQLSHVEVFSATGEHLKTLGRSGSGPGEFNGSFDMVFMPDGTLGVVQTFPGKIVKLNLDGTPAGEYMPDTGDATAGGFLVLVNVLGDAGDLVLTGMNISLDQANGTQTRSYFVKRFGADQQLKSDMAGVDRVWDFRDFTFTEEGNDWVWARIDMNQHGKVAVAVPRDDYEITIFNQDGSIDRIIERDYKHWQRNEKATARQEAATIGTMRQFPPNTPHSICDTEADVATLYYNDDGSLWVLTSRAMWEPKSGILHSYDVFDASGTFVSQLDVKCEGSSTSDLLLFAKNDLVFQITGFFDALMALQGGSAGGEDDEEAKPMEVICYRSK